jgi:hypothetical protein
MKQTLWYFLAFFGVIGLIFFQKMDYTKHKTTATVAVNPNAFNKSPVPKRDIASKSNANRELARKNQPYSLEYASNSAIKSVPLKNAKLSVKVYYSDNPDGIVSLKTDENQKFKFNNKYKDISSVALEVVSVAGQEKYNAICYGQTIPGKRSIQISCSHPEI